MAKLQILMHVLCNCSLDRLWHHCNMLSTSVLWTTLCLHIIVTQS